MTKKKSLDNMKVPTERFYDLLKKASQPLSEVKVQKQVRKKHGDYSDKQTRQRKAEDAED